MEGGEEVTLSEFQPLSRTGRSAQEKPTSLTSFRDTNRLARLERDEYADDGKDAMEVDEAAIAARKAAAEAEEVARASIAVQEAQAAAAAARAKKAASKKRKKKGSRSKRSRDMKPSQVKRSGGGYKLPDEPQLRIIHPDVISLFDRDRDLRTGLPYQKQGDESMYTAEMLAKRKALRDNRAVKAGIDKFLSLFAWNANDTFSKPAYVGMHGKLVEALLPGTGQADAVLLAERDWAKDSGGEKALSRQQAWDSIFQLIDIWTTSADAAEYIALIHALTFRVSFGDKANALITSSAVIGSKSGVKSIPVPSPGAAGSSGGGAGAGAGAGAGSSSAALMSPAVATTPSTTSSRRK